MKYRADIDGLRALAILAVALFHFNSGYLSGGFIGVDVFFVISGYIITTGIYPKILTNQFCFSSFYIKRIKRILPLFYLVTSFSLIGAFYLYTPLDFSNVAHSARYAVSFIANLYFAKNFGYFNPLTESMPLLHMWSLSIEEQFYLLWPILLIITTKLFSFKKTFIFFSIALISFIALSQYISITEPSKSYYLIQSRCFELLIGALLAICLYFLRKQKYNINKKALHVLGFIGLVGVICGFIFINKDFVFPGFTALFICILVCFIIVSGENNNLLQKILGCNVLTFIGKLSYSLYLWHWPVIAFYQYYFMRFNIIDITICGSITFLLSFISYYFFETPLRFLKIKNRYVFIFYLILPIIFFVFLAKNIEKNKGYPNRFSPTIQHYFKLTDTFSNITDKHIKIKNNNLLIQSEPYLLGDNNYNLISQISAIIWGDSHAEHFRNLIDLVGKEFNFSALYSGYSGCPPLLDTEIIVSNEERGIEKVNNKVKQDIKNLNIKYAFLAARWAVYTKNKNFPIEHKKDLYLVDENNTKLSSENSKLVFAQGLEKTISFLIKNNITPIIIEQVPVYSFRPTNCWIQKETLNNNISCNIDKNTAFKRLEFSNLVFEKLQKKYPQLIILKINKAICNKEKCLSKLGKTPLYYDNNHLNFDSATPIFNQLKKTSEYEKLKNIFTK